MIAYYDKPVIGFKSIRDDQGVKYIVTLLVPAFTRIRLNKTFINVKTKYSNLQALTVSGYLYTRFKFRAEYAEVLEIESLFGQTVDFVDHTPLNAYATPTNYTVGDIVYPDKPFDITDAECASGIHMFPERWMAELW